MADISTITLPNNQSYNLKDLRVNFKSTTNATHASNMLSNTAGRQYAVVMDKNGYLSVNVPWDDMVAMTTDEIDAICT